MLMGIEEVKTQELLASDGVDLRQLHGYNFCCQPKFKRQLTLRLHNRSQPLQLAALPT
jgi:hypothetical protein